MVTIWSNNEDTSSHEEEWNIANLCLMALKDGINSEPKNLEFTFDKLYTAFYDLLVKFLKNDLKNKTLKLINNSLTKEKDNFF